MKNLRDLKKYFIRYKKKLLLGFLFIIFTNAAMIYVPLVIKDAINELQVSFDASKLLEYAGLIVAAAVVSGFFRFLIRQTIIVVSREIEYDLRQDFWEHIQLLPLRYFQNTSTGTIMAHATNDIQAVRMFLGPAVMYSVNTVVTFLITLVIMFTISVEVTFYSLIPLPFLSMLVYWISKKIHHRFRLVQEKFEELTTRAQENFSGMRVIKSYVCEEREKENFGKASSEYLDRNMDLAKIRALFAPVLFMITGLSIIIVIWLGGGQVIQGNLLIGDITALTMYLGILIWPMIAFGWVINIIQQAEVAMGRLNKIFDEQYEIQDDPENNADIESIQGNISFRDVSFKYGEDLPEVLKNINLDIEAGSSIAIMGYTGSGKSTFMNLIPRLYDVTSGEILIDGVPIKNIPLKVLRKHIGYVQQEAFLLSDTIKANVSYGLDEFDMDIVKRAAGVAQFDKDIEMFPNKYETMLGERGITMSGGQKQRASLARALAVDPKILLLDDSFSAVDTHTEEDILKGLREYLKGRTSIIISHRVSTVKDADKIIVIDNGFIKEEGTHDELVLQGGIYAELYYKQLLEKEIEEFD